MKIKTNCILKAALDENNKIHNNGQHCWVSCIYYILKELDMLKMFKSPFTCGAREINIIRKLEAQVSLYRSPDINKSS